MSLRYCVFISQDRKHLSSLRKMVEHVRSIATGQQCSMFNARQFSIVSWTYIKLNVECIFEIAMLKMSEIVYTISIVALKWNNNRKMLRLRHCIVAIRRRILLLCYTVVLIICSFDKFSSTNKNRWLLYESVHTIVVCNAYDFDCSPDQSQFRYSVMTTATAKKTRMYRHKMKLDEGNNHCSE